MCIDFEHGILYHCRWFLFILLNCKFLTAHKLALNRFSFQSVFNVFSSATFSTFKNFVWVSLQQEVRNARKFGESCNDSTCDCLNNWSVLLPMGELCSIGPGFQRSLQNVSSCADPYQREATSLFGVPEKFFTCRKFENPPTLPFRRKAICLPGILFFFLFLQTLNELR